MSCARSVRCLFGALFVSQLLASPAWAQSGQTTAIAITGDPSPDGNGTFSFMAGPNLNNLGQAAFLAGLTDTNQGTADNSGVYLGSGGAITQIVREGQAAPDADGFFSNLFFSFDLNDQGQVAFFSLQANTLNEAGIFRGSGGAITQIVRAGQPTPDNNDVFETFTGPVMNGSGQVPFRGWLNQPPVGPGFDETGIYLGSGGAITQIARQDQLAPDGNGTFHSFPSSFPRLNESGQVTFRADLSAGSIVSGIFRGSGGPLTEIVREGQVAPDGNGTFSGFGFIPVINNPGQVAFRAGLTGTSGGVIDDSGLFLGSGGAITQIVREGQASPDTNGVFSRFSMPTLNSSGQLGFWAEMSGTSGGTTDDRGIFRSSGGTITQIAREGQVAPNGDGTFSNFLPFLSNSIGPAMNNSGVLAVQAELTGTSNSEGLFLGDGIDLIRAARVGQVLEGSTITSLDFFSRLGGLNEFGQVAYAVNLADGREVIGRFTPDLHYRDSGSGDWDTANNWTLGLDPNRLQGGTAIYDTFIDPDTTLTVTGPAADTMVKSLTVGGGAGTATLQMSTGLLTVAEDFTLASNGRLALELGGLGLGEFDQLSINGNLFLDGQLDVSLINGFTLDLNQEFLILDVDGTRTGQFVALGQDDLVGNFGGTDLFISYNEGTGNSVALYTSIPEPSSLLLSTLAGLGLITLGLRRRKRVA